MKQGQEHILAQNNDFGACGRANFGQDGHFSKVAHPAGGLEFWRVFNTGAWDIQELLSTGSPPVEM